MQIYEKDKHPLIEAIKRDIFDRGQNKLIVIVGGTQRGKSRLSLALAYLLDKNFQVKRNVAVIDPIWFMEIVEQHMPRCSCPIFDDAGVGINAQDWSDFQVKKLSRVMHIVGNKGYCMIISTPDYSFINAQVRRVVTDKIIVTKLDKKKHIIKFKYYCGISYDDKGKEYKSYPVKIYKNGKRRKINRFRIDEAPKTVLDEFYEIEKMSKDEYRQQSLTEAIKEKQLRKESAKTSTERVMEAIDKVKEHPEQFMSEYKGRKFIDISEIENKCGVGGRIAQRVKKQVERDLNL